MVFDGVEIDGAIAVIRLAHVVVVDDGIEPQSRDAKIFEIRQMVLNSLEVAAVVSLGSLAIVGAGRCALRYVVGGITVVEAIGHDEVDHVVACNAPEPSSLRKSLQQRQ